MKDPNRITVCLADTTASRFTAPLRAGGECSYNKICTDLNTVTSLVPKTSSSDSVRRTKGSPTRCTARLTTRLTLGVAVPAPIITHSIRLSMSTQIRRQRGLGDNVPPRVRRQPSLATWRQINTCDKASRQCTALERRVRESWMSRRFVWLCSGIN